MPQGDRSARTAKQERRGAATQDDHEPKGARRPEAQARAPAAASKLHGGSRKMDTRRKVPFGPVGGLGRKTNLARSS
jgi:hypothetical protein